MWLYLQLQHRGLAACSRDGLLPRLKVDEVHLRQVMRLRGREGGLVEEPHLHARNVREERSAAQATGPQ